MNLKRALELYGHSCRTWNQVGVVLAQEEGRRIPYKGESVQKAIRNEDRKREAESS